EEMGKKWSSPMYVFFKPDASILEVNGRRAHIFHCANTGCKRTVRRYLDTSDATSTGNLRKHIIECWSQEALNAAKACQTLKATRPCFEQYRRSGDIYVAFGLRRNSSQLDIHKYRYLRYVCSVAIVRWVTHNMRPFNIVEDDGFHELMKTGQLEYKLPSAMTVGHDVCCVFSGTREHIRKMLKEFDGNLDFATDAWTSPN
ncbi:hypothetical protein FOMPIDRAFT_8037, partial [Fomitopsis schrenkii]